MNPEGKSGQQPPTQATANSVPPVTGGWPQQPQPTPGGFPQPPSQSAPNAPQQPYTLPSGADGNAPEYSIDYLNQIAPKEQKVIGKFAVLGLIAGGIIAALFAVIIIASSGGPNANEQLIPISQRIATLQSVTALEQKHLSEDQISQANASLTSAFTSMNSSLQGILKERKLSVSSNSDSGKIEKIYKTKLTKILEDAYQRGTLDRTYTVQMTYELTVLKTNISKLKENSNSKSILAFCDTALEDITSILKSYASFDATKS